MKQRATKEWPVFTTDRISRPNVNIINKNAALDAIMTGQIAEKFIYLNVLWPDTVLKLDMICRVVALVMEVSPDITEKIIVARRGTPILTVRVQLTRNQVLSRKPPPQKGAHLMPEH